MTNSLDPDETPSYSASHPDPSCLHMAIKSLLTLSASEGLKQPPNDKTITWVLLALVELPAQSHNHNIQKGPPPGLSYSPFLLSIRNGTNISGAINT